MDPVTLRTFVIAGERVTLIGGSCQWQTQIAGVDPGVVIIRRLAVDDAYTMIQGTALTVPAPGVLANDTIPPGLTASVEFGPPFPPTSFTNLNGSGGFVLDFTVNPTFVGTTSFPYVFHTSDAGVSNPATVTVQVNPAPTPVSRSVSTVGQTSGAVTDREP